MAKCKAYFSGKHNFCGYKLEMSVLPIGLTINCIPLSLFCIQFINRSTNPKFSYERYKKVKTMKNDNNGIGPL